jgi:predicted permease
MLGITPALGRTLIPADAVSPGGNPVVVLSYAFWKAKFQQDPSVIGRTVLLQGHPFEIVGVARHGFAGIRADPPDFWAPITMYSQLLNGSDLFGPANIHPLEITGRLKPNVSINQARASLLVSGKALTANYALEDRVIGVGFQTNATSVPITRDTIEGALPGAVAFFLILLLACANVANMMLARGMARQREIGLRLALGAPRPRLIRQLLTEGFVLAIPSAVLGIVVTWIGSIVGIRALYAVIPSEFASQVRVMPINLDWRVFSFVLIAACVSTLAFALVPALQATRGDLVRATRGEFTNRHRTGRLRNILVAAQVAVCVMLLICAGILLRGSHHVQTIDLGIDVHNVIEIDTRQDLRARVSAILAADPSVEAQAAVWQTPIYGSVRGIAVAPQGESSFVNAGFNYVSPEFFQVFRIPIIRGRNFTAEEARAAAPVIVISESTARRFWPNADAVGQTLRIRRPPQNGRRSDDRLSQYTTAEVIGITRDAISDSDIFEIDRSCLYFPANAAAAADYAILARVRGNSELVRHSLDSSIAATLPGAVTQMIPMEQILEVRYLPFRLFAGISEALGGLALALTAIGIYGVIAYLVTHRSREIGIRIALGASSRSVIRLVLSQSVRLAVIGLAVGSGIAVAVARLAQSQFIMLNTLEVPVYVVSIVVVLAAAALAAAIPARRASRLDPMTILRHD